MIMKDRAADLFKSVGLDLVARPYGISGQTSAPEAAACAKELYGTDADVVTWDFSMTDGRWYWRLEFFAHRIAMLPGFPFMLVLNAGTDEKRREITNHLSKQGLGILRQDEKYVIDQHLRMPDSKFRTAEELEEMPENVRWFRCGYGIEYGPGCVDHKFTKNGTCDERSYQTNWHHGRYVFVGWLRVLIVKLYFDPIGTGELHSPVPLHLNKSLTLAQYCPLLCVLQEMACLPG